MIKDRLPPVFRLATAADADTVSEVYLASQKAFLPWLPRVHTDGEVRQWIRTYLIPTRRVTVAILDDEVVGMMALSDSDHGAVGWIDQLYLHPDVVRRGIGTALLERAKMELGSPIRLYTFQANEGARRFYERHGFRAIAFGDGSQNEEQCPDVLYEWQA
ncbi:GNAT family N-acetyltransferase [Candidatus Entotheonella palauensis]|uniref:GNAT family N-acetyltransferase n=1 Tax=Candidatus Entotheonella palauensis TaxID=93172 RepID=UPI000B7D4DE4|nr:GNAT family N-acetyltransferase [Candidatus Entotheonella palauensis]